MQDQERIVAAIADHFNMEPEDVRAFRLGDGSTYMPTDRAYTATPTREAPGPEWQPRGKAFNGLWLWCKFRT